MVTRSEIDRIIVLHEAGYRVDTIFDILNAEMKENQLRRVDVYDANNQLILPNIQARTAAEMMCVALEDLVFGIFANGSFSAEIPEKLTAVWTKVLFRSDSDADAIR